MSLHLERLSRSTARLLGGGGNESPDGGERIEVKVPLLVLSDEKKREIAKEAGFESWKDYSDAKLAVSAPHLGLGCVYRILTLVLVQKLRAEKPKLTE